MILLRLTTDYQIASVCSKKKSSYCTRWFYLVTWFSIHLDPSFDNYKTDVYNCLLYQQCHPMSTCARITIHHGMRNQQQCNACETWNLFSNHVLGPNRHFAFLSECIHSISTWGKCYNTEQTGYTMPEQRHFIMFRWELNGKCVYERGLSKTPKQHTKSFAMLTKKMLQCAMTNMM